MHCPSLHNEHTLISRNRLECNSKDLLRIGRYLEFHVGPGRAVLLYLHKARMLSRDNFGCHIAEVAGASDE